MSAAAVAKAPQGARRSPPASPRCQGPARGHDHDDRDAVVQAFALSTPFHAAQALGLQLAPRMSPRLRSVRVACPWHADTNPSCDLTIKRGRVVAVCRSCGGNGDVLAIVAAQEQLDVRREFAAVLSRAAQIVGVDTRAARRSAASGELSPLDRARIELRDARREIERLEGALRRLREELTEEQAERLTRLDAAHDVARGLSDVVVAARMALPALREAAEGPSRPKVREAIEVLAGALGEAT